MARELTTIMMEDNASVGDSDSNIDVPSDGELMKVILHISGNSMDGAGDGARAEIAFGSTNKFGINDARGIVARVQVNNNGATFLGRTDSVQIFDYGPMGIKVFGGERIHMHTANIASGAVFEVWALLAFRFKTSSSRR